MAAASRRACGVAIILRTAHGGGEGSEEFEARSAKADSQLEQLREELKRMKQSNRHLDKKIKTKNQEAIDQLIASPKSKNMLR